MNTLRAQLAPRIAPVVLTNITTRYPYYDGHLFLEGETPVDPTSAHPAFGNSFDWHSSAHSHWTAMRLLEHPAQDREMSMIAGTLRDAVAKNLTAENLAAEAAYFAARPTYERPYGWAWALMLAAGAGPPPLDGLHAVGAPLHRLAQQLAGEASRWLDALPSPVRHGVHGNTAYALGLMLDASQALGFLELERTIRDRARRWFAADRAYPADWERSGHDFLSPGLAEADLMRRVMPGPEFTAWWREFLPETRESLAIFEVAVVPDVRDGQIAHLHGLNLSRAGALARIAATLRDQSDELLTHSQRLYDAGVVAAAGDDYFSTHWLPTFAWDAATSIDFARAVT